MAGRGYENGDVVNKYQYNGKELEDDLFAGNKTLMWYHYGARYYDPQLGKWWVVDPADEFSSPYVFCSGNPIIYIDKDGNVVGLIIKGDYAISNLSHYNSAIDLLKSTAIGKNYWDKISNDDKTLVLFGTFKYKGDFENNGGTLGHTSNSNPMSSKISISDYYRYDAKEGLGYGKPKFIEANELISNTDLTNVKAENYSKIVVVQVSQKIMEQTSKETQQLGIAPDVLIAHVLSHEIGAHILSNKKSDAGQHNDFQGPGGYPSLYDLKNGNGGDYDAFNIFQQLQESFIKNMEDE